MKVCVCLSILYVCILYIKYTCLPNVSDKPSTLFDTDCDCKQARVMCQSDFQLSASDVCKVNNAHSHTHIISHTHEHAHSHVYTHTYTHMYKRTNHFNKCHEECNGANFVNVQPLRKIIEYSYIYYTHNHTHAHITITH